MRLLRFQDNLREMIQIMKASAGSGKTFNLARKYITLLLGKGDMFAYRHILAVTFTNKATDEMKSRILKELYILSSEPEKSGYLKWFIPEMFSESELADVREADIVRELPGMKGRKITLELLRQAAGAMLSNMLHDYGAFSVSTIDRFFQQTLKAFSREIGQFASYRVELDRKSLIDESVDRILDSLGPDRPDLLRWLTDCAMDYVEKGERYSLDAQLKKMAGRLKSDEHRIMVQDSGIDESALYSYDNLRNIRAVCTETISAFRGRVAGAAKAVMDVLGTAGVAPEKFNGGFLAKIRNYADPEPHGTMAAPSPSFMTKAADPEKWFSKAAAKTMLPLVYPALEEPLNAFCDCFGDDFRLFNTAVILLGQLYELGVASDLYREFDAVLKEKNVLSIDDSNTILKNIIDGSDAPFIYEKTGIRYENFLLDEFQDTSSIQWDNFRPLIRNSIASGQENLIVGDVKQSIYRWRGSDWSLLDSGIRGELSEVEDTVLDRNFRSCRNIVEFNNSFFTFAAAALDSFYGMRNGKPIADIYSDVAQKAAAGNAAPGQVRVTFCREEDETGQVLSTIAELRESGASFGDITVLVRSREPGIGISAALIANSIPVITDDSLKVKSSVMVRRLASLLSYADSPGDTVNSFLAGSLDVEIPDESHSLADLCEIFCRALREKDPAGFDAEITYIQSFVDCVLDYASANGSNLHDFLCYWSDSSTDPSISSPSGADAVRIMTVHKAKGLDAGYVIFPYAEKVDIFRTGNSWCRPDLKGTALESADGVYDVVLSSASNDTFFREDYLDEKKKQYIDNINIFYVALTRAVKGMHVIAAAPSATFMKSKDKDIPQYADFSNILYVYMDRFGVKSGFTAERDEDTGALCYKKGEIPDFSGSHAGEAAGSVLPPSYRSWPLNPVSLDGTCLRNRIVFSGDAYDFFHGGVSGPEGKSARVKGIILHQILSGINTAADISKAVSDAVASGLIGSEDAAQTEAFFRERIASVSARGWFSKDAVRIYNEASVIDTDGEIYRPDRVELHPDGKVTVIDYKFGAQEKAYLRQISRYASLWRRRGCTDVSACLWYVLTNDVVEA